MSGSRSVTASASWSPTSTPGFTSLLYSYFPAWNENFQGTLFLLGVGDVGSAQTQAAVSTLNCVLPNGTAVVDVPRINAEYFSVTCTSAAADIGINASVAAGALGNSLPDSMGLPYDATFSPDNPPWCGPGANGGRPYPRTLAPWPYACAPSATPAPSLAQPLVGAFSIGVEAWTVLGAGPFGAPTTSLVHDASFPVTVILRPNLFYVVPLGPRGPNPGIAFPSVNCVSSGGTTPATVWSPANQVAGDLLITCSAMTPGNITITMAAGTWTLRDGDGNPYVNFNTVASITYLPPGTPAWRAAKGGPALTTITANATNGSQLLPFVAPSLTYVLVDAARFAPTNATTITTATGAQLSQAHGGFPGVVGLTAPPWSASTLAASAPPVIFSITSGCVSLQGVPVNTSFYKIGGTATWIAPCTHVGCVPLTVNSTVLPCPSVAPPPIPVPPSPFPAVFSPVPVSPSPTKSASISRTPAISPSPSSSRSASASRTRSQVPSDPPSTSPSATRTTSPSPSPVVMARIESSDLSYPGPSSLVVFTITILYQETGGVDLTLGNLTVAGCGPLSPPLVTVTAHTQFLYLCTAGFGEDASPPGSPMLVVLPSRVFFTLGGTPNPVIDASVPYRPQPRIVCTSAGVPSGRHNGSLVEVYVTWGWWEGAPRPDGSPLPPFVLLATPYSFSDVRNYTSTTAPDWTISFLVQVRPNITGPIRVEVPSVEWPAPGDPNGDTTPIPGAVLLIQDGRVSTTPTATSTTSATASSTGTPSPTQTPSQTATRSRTGTRSSTASQTPSRTATTSLSSSVSPTVTTSSTGSRSTGATKLPAMTAASSSDLGTSVYIVMGLGGTLFLVAAAIVTLWMLSRRRQKEQKAASQPSQPTQSRGYIRVSEGSRPAPTRR